MTYQTRLTKPDLTIDRRWAMPSAWTFSIEPIREIVERETGSSDGLWVDPFAGRSEYADMTNDLDPEKETDYTLRATEFLGQFETGSVDGGVLWDPPYSPRQIKEVYDSVGMEVTMEDTQSTFYSDIRDEIARITATGATVVTCMWNSSGVGKNRGFRKRHIRLVCHGGAHNDTIVTVEDKK